MKKHVLIRIKAGKKTSTTQNWGQHCPYQVIGTLNMWIINIRTASRVCMFSFSNIILLVRVWTKYLMNNFISSTKKISDIENWFLFSLWNSSVVWETTYLSFNRDNYVMREKSSIKIRKYLKLLKDGKR